MLALSLVLLAVQQPPSAPASGQGLPPQVGDTSPFRRLDLPTATLIREGSGLPGPRYWQQRADYTIRASLDTATQAIRGSETIRYTNNSPDTLRYIWLQLDQNIYKTNSRGNALSPADTRFLGHGYGDGYMIHHVQVLRSSGGTHTGGHGTVALPTTMNGTMMRADLDRPLAPGQVATLEVAYMFEVPLHGSDRMGREQYPSGWEYEIAQWYPRVAVYDDVRGWNTEQYLGQGEFYLEYGDFDVAITVPRNYIVAATGTLANPAEVLTASQRARLARAARSDSTIAIIAKTEVGQPSTRPAGPGAPLTWHFIAKNVRDVAWAAAGNFIWDASGYDGALIQSFYPPEANADWARSTEYARHSIKHYSEKWYRYPYPTAINVAGPVSGMEYPMIVFCGHGAGDRALFGVTTHELGHQWFPMVVGSNERLYAWMDEGFNTFINIYSTLAFYRDTVPRDRGNAIQWARFAASGQDEPSILAADRITPRVLGQDAYNKPATGLYLLRQHILDDSTRFDMAFREYIRRWAYKHPTPADFFRSMDDGLGEDLSWFWRGWFFRTDVVDLAVDSARSRTDSTGTTAFIGLSSLGGLPMPVDLHLTYANGITEDVRLPVEIWFQGNRYVYTPRVPAAVMKVEIDAGQNFPDVRRANNIWQKDTASQ